MNKKEKVICWFSGGVTSAVACKLSIDMFGIDNCEIIMIDTRNEDPDTYRFKDECEKWYGLPITVIGAFTDDKSMKNYTKYDVGYDYTCIQDVWRKFNSLNVAKGAICSSILKRKVREVWQKTNTYKYQVFGFEFEKKEFNRAMSMTINHPSAKAIYPLLTFGYNKKKCISIMGEAGIMVPAAYTYGLKNNNCLKTGCVQGGIGYWQKIKELKPDLFNNMANIEHELSIKKGKPVTMLKDQSKKAKESGINLVFLKHCEAFPEYKSIDDMPVCKVEPLFECNGFCGLNDLIERVSTEKEINYEKED